MGEPNKITIPLHALVGESSKDVEEEEWFGDRVANALNELIDENYTRGFTLGCIVGAAIVAWGDAMRGMVRFREHQRRITTEFRGTFTALARDDEADNPRDLRPVSPSEDEP